MLEIKNVNKKINDKKILENINMKFSAGEITGIMGSNGSSKTMLLNVIAKNLDPDSGELIYSSNKISGCIGKVNLIEEYTVKETLEEITTNKEVIEKILQRFAIKEYENQKVKKLSLGTKQKVWLSTMLCKESDVYLLDEPFNSLDENSVNILKNIILELKEKNKLVILVSHNKEDLDLCKNIYILEEGKVISNNENLTPNYEKYLEKEKENCVIKNRKKVIKYILILALISILVIYNFSFKSALKESVSLREKGKYQDAYDKIKGYIFMPNIEEIEKTKLYLQLNVYTSEYSKTKQDYTLFLGLKEAINLEKNITNKEYLKICNKYIEETTERIITNTKYTKEDISKIILLKQEEILELVGKNIKI